MLELGTKNHPFLENPASVLRDLLIERKHRNPNYSARAFARDAGISAAYLSQIFMGKRNLSLKQTLLLADRLGIDLHSNRTKHQKTSKKQFDLVQNSIEHDKIIRYWYHFAILELSQLKNNSNDPSWISNRLGISELEARSAVARLLQFGYLESNVKKLKRATRPFIFDAKKTSSSLRSQHQNRLQAASEELNDASTEAVKSRNMQTIFIATSRTKIESAKTMINEFTQRLMKHLADEEPEEVFQYSTQLFSVESKIKNNRTPKGTK